MNYLSSNEQSVKSNIDCLCQIDKVPEKNIANSNLSRVDKHALKIMEESKNLVYQIALPWKLGTSQVKDNFEPKMKRLSYLTFN